MSDDTSRARRKTRALRKGRDVAASEIQRIWGDLPVVDGLHDLRIIMNAEDVRRAKRKDEARCVFAQACRRVFGSQKVLFFRTVAYVELPGEDGQRRVERFFMTRAMRDLVASFDRGDGVIPEGGFLLKAPRGSNTLDGKRAKNQAAGNRIRDEIVGEVVPKDSSKRAPFQDEPLTIDLVRSGIGAVHFARKQPRDRPAAARPAKSP